MTRRVAVPGSPSWLASAVHSLQVECHWIEVCPGRFEETRTLWAPQSANMARKLADSRSGRRPRALTCRRWRSAVIPTRTPLSATTPIGPSTSKRSCRGEAIASTKPPNVAPTANPTGPTAETSVAASTRRLFSYAVGTNAIDMLAMPSTIKPARLSSVGRTGRLVRRIPASNRRAPRVHAPHPLQRDARRVHVASNRGQPDVHPSDPLATVTPPVSRLPAQRAVPQLSSEPPRHGFGGSIEPSISIIAY